MNYIAKIMFLLWNLIVASTEAKFLRTSEANVQRSARNKNGILHGSISGANARRLIVTQSILVIIHPFTVTIGPTPEPLNQTQIVLIKDSIENLVQTKLQNDTSYVSFNLTEAAEVVHNSSEVVKEWITKIPKSTLDYKRGVIAHMTGDIPSAKDLSDKVLEILEQDLLSSLQAYVDAELTSLTVEMHAPPTDSPSSHSDQPSITPSAFPSELPSSLPSPSPSTTPSSLAPSLSQKPTSRFSPSSSPSSVPSVPSLEPPDRTVPLLVVGGSMIAALSGICFGCFRNKRKSTGKAYEDIGFPVSPLPEDDEEEIFIQTPSP